MVQTSFVEHLDRVVQAAPEQVAIESNDQSITYLQLQQASLRIASQLFQSLSGPDEVVGLHLEKSASFLAAAIACWRLRCAWVPIAPQLPQTRQQFVLDDCRPKVVFTDDPRAKQFTFLQEHFCISDQPTVAIDGWRASDLAYVIYTSGTTGVPCGVEVTHQGIMNLLRAQVEAFNLDSNSRSVWYYQPTFDASVSDWGTALYAGGTLLIDQELGRFEPYELMAWLREKRITHVDLPPSLLKILPDKEASENLKTIVIGGQATDPETISRWSAKVRLVNVYGPTEATVCTSLNVCKPGEQRAMLGTPISEVSYHVVDSELNRVRPGDEGELLIVGPCVARGYRNQPRKTRRQFIEFRGQRGYRTGDLVRQDADGCMVYLGRIDRQFNLNGLRIEPEEIESVIVSIPGITRSAVLLRKIFPQSTKPRLVAFIEAADGLSVEEIRSRLVKVLSSERIPQRFEIRANLPSTDSGKIDLRTLEDCELEDQNVNEAGDGRLKAVLELFREATGESRFGPDHHWRDWGADSLSALHLVSLGAQHDLELPLWLLNTNPSPREVVDFLENNCRNEISPFPYACPISRLREDAERVRKEFLPACTLRLTGSSCSGSDILLTGATGFLGARILEQLLHRCDSRIICLIRPGQESENERLDEHLRMQEIGLPASFRQRLVLQTGDVTRPRLGMEDSIYRNLLDAVGSVVHCAADISVLASYEELRPANLVGTARMLEFCRLAGAHFHYASTLSVFVGTDAYAGVFHEASQSLAQRAFGGYAQSKIAAEFLLANEAVSPMTLHRCGLLVADARSGVYPQNDILTSLVRGLIHLGCVPKTNEPLRFDVTPVDYAAAAMAATVSAQLEGQPKEVVHIAGRSTMTLERLTKHLRRYVSIEEVSAATFWSRLSDGETCERLGRLEAAVVHASFSRWLIKRYDLSRAMDLFQSTETTFDCHETGEFVESKGVDWPHLTNQLVDRVLSRLCRESVRR